MSDVEMLRDTITPKSDQLNADSLMAGPITVTVTDVRRGSTEQPIDIHISGGHQCWKPCKSMRRILITAWGDNGKSWIGKSMTLYCEPSVKFGGVAVGGIRVSALSDIDSDLAISLTTTRGKRSPYTVKKLSVIYYDPAKFDANLPAWIKALGGDVSKADGLIAKIEQGSGCKFTDEQKAQIKNPQEAAK